MTTSDVLTLFGIFQGMFTLLGCGAAVAGLAFVGEVLAALM